MWGGLSRESGGKPEVNGKIRPLLSENLGEVVGAIVILTKLGWLEFTSVQFIAFREAGLSMESSDRLVWRYAQENQMIVLAANRNMKGEGSLEQVIREESTVDSFPGVTIGNLNSLDEFDYREQCTEPLIEIVLDIDNFMGAGRLFIP